MSRRPRQPDVGGRLTGDAVARRGRVEAAVVAVHVEEEEEPPNQRTVRPGNEQVSLLTTLRGGGEVARLASPPAHGQRREETPLHTSIRPVRLCHRRRPLATRPRDRVEKERPRGGGRGPRARHAARGGVPDRKGAVLAAEQRACSVPWRCRGRAVDVAWTWTRRACSHASISPHISPYLRRAELVVTPLTPVVLQLVEERVRRACAQRGCQETLNSPFKSACGVECARRAEQQEQVDDRTTSVLGRQLERQGRRPRLWTARGVSSASSQRP